MSAMVREIWGFIVILGVALVLMILGGWILFLGKREAPWLAADLHDEAMLERWATHWARVLDAPSSPF